MTVATLESTRVFSPYEDRCDRCGAQAYHASRKDVSGIMRELLFCQHHYLKHANSLLEQGWRIFNKDDRTF